MKNKEKLRNELERMYDEAYHSGKQDGLAEGYRVAQRIMIFCTMEVNSMEQFNLKNIAELELQALEAKLVSP